MKEVTFSFFLTRLIINQIVFFFRYDFYEKAVTFKPYQVDMLDPVTANFLGDNLRCWMQIQVQSNGFGAFSTLIFADL